MTMSGDEFDVLYESAMRMDEAGMRVVVNSKGEHQVVHRRLANVTAVRLKGAWWSPEEMLRYVGMTRKERATYRGLKLTFRATGEFV